MRFRPFLLLATAVLLAACSTTPLLPDQPGAVGAIEDYYARHAWEEGARCVLPRMSVTAAEVVESADGRTVVEVRYFWRDNRLQSDNGATTCAGFASRRFTLEGGRVVAMTGEQRPSTAAGPI
ncbi:hypothetical protein [Geminicoccus flavidas]|uniref:hypothetical protein n=1 Tax=Geminicoccus flavidas TaxID=2506407 RepID=UPI00135C3B0F|nr:hypothetical protein [Geminicoccus flavidas]